MKKVLRIIDSISDQTGRVIRWFCYALILVVVYDVTMRYVFNAPTMWAYETAIMIGGSIYVLSFAYTLRHRGHIRIDIFYARLSLRGKAIIDVLGTFFLFFPLLALVAIASYTWMWKAWVTGERSFETYWYPPLAPFRTVILIGYCLLAFQAVTQFIRDLYVLLRNRPYD